MRNRENRYRRNLLQTFLSVEQRRRLAPVWARKFRTKRPSLESVCEIFLTCWPELFPKGWTNGNRSTNGHPFFDVRLKSFPEAAYKALLYWRAHPQALIVDDYVPSVHEVLERQSRGLRSISVLVTEKDILHFEKEGMDFLSFIIHDLIHANHFFNDPWSHREQIKFSKRLLEMSRAGFLKALRQSGENFIEDFEYLASDMNSHPEHLKQTLLSLAQRSGTTNYL